MVTIAFVHNRFPAGGAERITIDIARYLKGVGNYRIYVYTTRVEPQLINEELNEFLTIRRIPSQANQFIRSAAVEKYIGIDGVDILVQVGKSLKGIDRIRRRTGCKSVVACHGEPFWQRYAIMNRRQKGKFRKILWKLYAGSRYGDGTLAMSKAIERTRKQYLESDAFTVLCSSYKKRIEDVLGIDTALSRVHYIENPELPVENVCWNKENIVLFCGRFENWSKRLDRLFRIWKKVQHRMPQWRLALVGDGADGPMLRQMAEELCLERVSFEGLRKDVDRYYDAASIVAMTSETEGWPLALSEAQARGCIGVAFECSAGISEILGPDGECGFIIPPFDEDLYADTLVQIASMTDQEQMRIRKNAVQKRLNYTPESIAEKWKMLFDSLVSR